MKVSQLVVKTLREIPASAEIPSHVFLLRGGYIKQLSSGLYSILPLGKRILQKIETIIRDEMDSIGGQEVDLPLVHPKELWEESGRYEAIGDELLRFKDRTNHNMVLAMTHEEAVTDLMRHIISSYKQLPALVYQFKLKFRDEPRARGGLIRVREFVMKDAYSFHSSAKSLDDYYRSAYQAYERIFAKVGIEPIVVQSDTGIMGGKLAHEFMLEADSGEDYLILSEDGKYKANQEIAVFDRECEKNEMQPLEKVETPNSKTIEEVCSFLKIEAKQTVKAVFYMAENVLIVVCLRGDLDVSEIKVKNHLKISELIPADDEQIQSHGMVAGYASVIGLEENDNFKILLDESVTDSSNLVAGANEAGYHFTNANYQRDITSGTRGDFAMARAGHKSLKSDSRLREVRGIEIGNIFKLGTKFSSSMKAHFLNKSGKEQPMVMGCYGIGVGRLMASVVENSHDKFGPIWPKNIAPYRVHLLNIGSDEPVIQACKSLYQELQEKGIDILFDDRDERPGVKFKDADLWGIPIRIAISTKTLANSQCEWKIRGEKDFNLIPLEEVQEKVQLFYKN